MLIKFEDIIKKYIINTNRKILHIGAHLCEERDDYLKLGFTDDKVVWIEGNKSIVEHIKNINPNINIYNAIISNKDNEPTDFIITNNGQSSSILELDEHLIEHPSVYEIDRYKGNTITVETLLKNYNINYKDFEFVNLDIQGAELFALQGMINILPYVRYIYSEVNIKCLYKNSPLLKDIDKFLDKYGFKRVDINMTEYGWGDALYVKKDDPEILFGNCNSITNGELNFYNNIKNKCDIIFDIGCRYDSLFTDFTGEVHYFEPEITFIDKLKIQTNQNRVSIFNNYGLSNSNEELWYYPKYQSFYNRIISCKENDDINKIKFNVKKASDYIKEKNIEKIDFVKIDTEGSEFNIIKGFEDKISIIQVIQFEYGGTFLDNNTSLSDIIEYLKSYGFKKFGYLYENGVYEIINYLDHYKYCNIVCFKNSE